MKKEEDMDSPEKIEEARLKVRAATERYEKALEEKHNAEKAYAMALCPYTIGERVSGFDGRGTSGIVEDIRYLCNDYEVVIRPFKKDGNPASVVRNIAYDSRKKLVRC